MKLSVIIPVFREEKIICRAIARIRDLALSGGVEIIVCDGDPRALTLAHVTKTLGRSRDLILVASGKGRGVQMNAGAGRARGDLLFFLHADTRPDFQGMDLMLKTREQYRKKPGPDTFCGAFDLHIDSSKKIFRLIEKTASFRSRFTRIPYGDQGIFISRSFFRRLGGFPEVPVMEDVGLMEKVRAAGARPIIFKHAISTSARRWETQGILYTTLRNWVLITLYHTGVCPGRLARYY